MENTTDHMISVGQLSERLNATRDRVADFDRRLDAIAQGAMEKLRGDVELATRVNAISKMVESLDSLVVRGSVKGPSLKSVIESLLGEVEDLERNLEALRADLVSETQSFRNEMQGVRASIQKSSEDSAAMVRAQMEKSSLNWKTTATIITSALASITAIILALLSGG